MKKILAGSLLPMIILVVLLISGCKKDNPTTVPTITTSAVSSVGATSAICGGKITSIGGEVIIDQGVCWSTTENPTMADQKKVDVSGSRTFTVTITGLTDGGTYHVRAYATNIKGTSYGDDVVFTTKIVPIPTVTTNEITSITITTAVGGGVITSDGGAAITAKGICWSISANPTTADSTTNEGTGSESFTSNITGLDYETVYHVRAYATNFKGTSYGADVPFTTLPAGMPTVTTNAVTSITATTAISGGVIVSDGGGAITAKGVCWSTTANPTVALATKTTDGTGSASFVSNLTNLASSTYYHVRAYATNNTGTAYGSDVLFTTTKVTSTAEEEFLLGNPSNATTNSLSPDYFTNYLLSKPQYCLSFNNTTHNTNWTSWHLFSGDIGSANPNPSFVSETALPTGFYPVDNWDYQWGTYGFERGHMCPSADRTSTDANNIATYVMSNAIPQSPNCNGIVWGALESYCRSLVSAGNELYIICGPYGQGGTSNGPNGTGAVQFFNFVNNNAGGVNIVVPAKVWKVILVLPNGNDDISRITTTTRVIAVIMPNTVDCNTYDWKHYRVSVDALETLTGFDFLSNVPPSIQAVIEASVDNL